jgi:hypothetical protein
MNKFVKLYISVKVLRKTKYLRREEKISGKLEYTIKSPRKVDVNLQFLEILTPQQHGVTPVVYRLP